MTECWLVVNTLLGVGMQVVAEAVAVRVDPGPASRAPDRAGNWILHDI